MLVTLTRLRRSLGHLFSLAVVLAVLAWLILLRPAALGGTTAYVFVAGPSMAPTYQVGDLVVARPSDAYAPGMIVVYRIPVGEPGTGKLVVHRIVSGTADSGFTTQGDNNDYTDVWHPREADIVGTVDVVVPQAGVVVKMLRQPLIAATLATLVATLVLWPRPQKPRSIGQLPSRPHQLLET